MNVIVSQEKPFGLKNKLLKLYLLELDSIMSSPKVDLEQEWNFTAQFQLMVVTFATENALLV